MNIKKMNFQTDELFSSTQNLFCTISTKKKFFPLTFEVLTL